MSSVAAYDVRHGMPNPPPRFLHSADTLSPVELSQPLSAKTGDLVESLSAGRPGALKVGLDGTVLEGHHRLAVLGERGVDIDASPREASPRNWEPGMMRAHVFWVAGPWPGRLGILLRPRGGDWLEDEAKAWREAGVDVVVSLLEPDEEAQLALEGEAAAAAASGVAFRVFPIPDRGVPASRDSVAQLTRDLVDALGEDRNVAVHCRHGIGRSGLIVGSVLVAGGTVLAEALGAIKESRGLEVPETDRQRQWLDDFAPWLESTRAAQRAAAADERRTPLRTHRTCPIPR